MRPIRNFLYGYFRVIGTLVWKHCRVFSALKLLLISTTLLDSSVWLPYCFMLMI